MNKIKLFIASALFCTMGYVGYNAYERMTMSETERIFLTNVEAMTSDEGPTVRKNCGLIWGKGCYADNYGANCDAHSDCSN